MRYLDLSYLHQNVTDDPAFIAQVLDVFISGLNTDIPLLRQAIESGDHLEIKNKAHKVKSGFRSLGISEMTETLQSLENMAKDERQIEDIRSAFASFDNTLPAVIEEITSYRNTL